MLEYKFTVNNMNSPDHMHLACSGEFTLICWILCIKRILIYAIVFYFMQFLYYFQINCQIE